MKDKSGLIFSHDRLFKEIWSHSENARTFFKHYLPENILKVIDLKSLELQKGSFVEKNLKEYHSDLLYKVKTLKGDAFIYLLFEHKSYIDGLIHLQLLKYMTGIWSLSIKQSKDKKLSPIIPLVLYHGKQSWTVPLLFSEIFQPFEESMKDYIPDFQYLLYDLSSYSDEDIKGSIILRLVMLLFKYIFNPEFEEKLPDIVRLLSQLKQDMTGLQYIETLLRYIVSNKKDFKPEEFLALMEKTMIGFKEEGEKIMSFAKTIIGQSYNEGRQKGVLEGLGLGLKSAIADLFEIKFGDSDALELIKEEVKIIESTERLEKIKNLIKKSDDIEEVFKILKN